MTRRCHILVVEDDADLREAVVIVLRSEGHHVVEAANGQLALDALASSGPGFGVIVLDLMMPVMDGATFLAHKAKGDHAGIPVVIFSASPCGDLTRSAGVCCMVPKLLGIEGLLAALRSAGNGALIP